MTVALVSGANRGIGREIARQLAGEGLTVVLGARDEAAARSAAQEIGGDSHPRQLDVTDSASVDSLAGSLEADFGGLDALVNNAGIGSFGISGAEPDLDKAQQVLDVNLLGTWRLSAVCAPLLCRSGHGRIVNLSSGMGQLSDMGGGAASYRVSKAGVNALTRIFAKELSGDGVLVNSVCPGWVRTDMGTDAAARSVEEGADTPVWLATLPDDGPSGGFFRDREAIPW
ncbi:MAG TPA: SDR family oxidoreductase [Solirubrobacteraceae bacterium]|jgi:NAD(P)-dependent dehydrogenase (short-subunit alcohol dehydrogenase family)